MQGRERALMEKWGLFWLMLFFIFSAQETLSQDTSRWLSIDCGAATSYRNSDDIWWQTDEEFIKTGTNRMVSPSSYTTWQQMDSLRVFTKQNKNCYTLPTTQMTRFFIRAMFNYGNYDLLSKPPTFDLEIDGNKWTTVQTYLKTIAYHEVIYTSKAENISVCLARTQPDQFPFISSLEALPLPDTMYAGMSRDLAWLKVYRYKYGAEDWIVGYPDDKYNRLWEPDVPQDLVSVIADTTILDYTTYEEPPDSAVFDAVEAPSASDSITLSFEITQTNSLSHVVMYYTEMAQTNETRSFDIYVDNEFLATTSPEYQNCTAEVANSQPVGAFTVDLRPTPDSTLPPIISAIEVYTASDPLVTTGTSQDDLDGLAVLTSTFKQLEGWSGEPCLPSDTVWEWLQCGGTDPPRVTSINLTGYGLDGPLPQFSQMKALETIYLGDNSLDGPIPEFLGQLPNLTILNLNNNNFSGKIPRSITSNKKLTYNFTGNPGIPRHKSKNWGLIVGLPVGILSVIILAILLALVLRRRRQKQAAAAAAAAQGQNRPDPEQQCQNGTAEEDTVSTSTNMDSVVQDSQKSELNEPTPANIPTMGSNGTTNQESQNNSHAATVSEAPEMDMEELEQRIQDSFHGTGRS